MSKWLFPFFPIFLLVGCNNSQTEKINPILRPLSRTQQKLDSLASCYQRDYIKARIGLKDSVVKKYHLLLNSFLMDSLHGGIDSLKVTVDSVRENNFKVTTNFHTNSRIAFKYTLGFERNMRPDWDSLYTFMKSLKPNTNTTIGFIYFGAHEINDPSDDMPVFRFFAFPVPLDFGKNN